MWSIHQPVQVIFGKGETHKIGNYLTEKGFNKALLIASSTVSKTGLADRLINDSEGKILAVTTEVEPNPTIENVDGCVRKAKEVGAECIIAIGGGSVIDCAKATCAAVAGNYTGEDLINGGTIKKALPLIAIPTTSGASSELTAGAVLSWKEKGRKEAIFSPALFPAMAIVDPELTYTCPPKLTAVSGIDVIAHSLDALSSVKANPVTDSLAIKSARLAFENLEAVFKNGNDVHAREQMALGSTIAGLAFSQTGTTGSHACSYILTSKYGVPHGEACAFTLDAWFIINAKEKPLLNEHAKQIGFEDAEALAKGLNELKEKVGLRSTLEEINVSVSDIDEIVASSMASSNISNNIAQIGSEGVKQLFLSKIGSRERI